MSTKWPVLKWIDAHAHLSSPELLPLASTLIERAQQSGVEAILNIATNPSEIRDALLLQEKHPRLLVAAATTPHDAEKEGELYFEEIASYARAGKLIALGETGLDYHYYSSSAEKQKEMLRRYLHLANELSLPIIIHCREAFSDLIEIIDAFYSRPGMLHCFTGTASEAAALVERGWYLSFSGIVTFPKSQALREVAAQVPLDQLLLETDAPYLAPIPFRGKQNEPSYLPYTAECIAAVKGISLQELSEATLRNTRSLFVF